MTGRPSATYPARTTVVGDCHARAVRSRRRSSMACARLTRGVPGSPGEYRRALNAHPVLDVPGRAHRVDRRDDRVSTLGHLAGVALVGELADVLGDAVQRRRTAGAADNGASLCRPLDERPAHRGSHQPVRTGYHDDW